MPSGAAGLREARESGPTAVFTTSPWSGGLAGGLGGAPAVALPFDARGIVGRVPQFVEDEEPALAIEVQAAGEAAGGLLAAEISSRSWAVVNRTW
jgi:hypothetical protein